MQNETEKLLDGVNGAQKEAILHGQGPLLIVAGAGTGKTSVLTKRLAHLVMSGKAKSDEVLAVTFTDKAAAEMEERIDRLLPYGYVDLWVMTFHALGERILRENALAIGLPDSFKMLSESDQWLLVRQNLDRFSLNYYKPLGNPTKFIHALLRHISRAKDELITPEQYLEYAQSVKLDADKAGDAEESTRLAEVAEAYHVYTRLLRENDALDFGDLIAETVRLLKTRPKILERYRRQFKYLIVDEFQDTNIAQFELLRLLAGEEANITVVGDDDQSIYKFRGASVSNILQFKEFYPQSKQVVLTENYRSPQIVLDAAYKFIQANNPNRLEAQLGDGLSKKLHANVEEKGFVRSLRAETVTAEARGVANEILSRLKADKGTNLSQFAILSRSNDGALPFISALAAAQIPYIFYASRGLYQKPIVIDILSYLKLLDNYHESTAVYRILASPAVGLSHDDIVRLSHGAAKKTWSLYEACRSAQALEVSEDGLERVRRFLSLVEKHSALAKSADVRRVVFAFLEDSGYLKKLVGEDGELNRDTLSYINQFWRVIEEFVAAEPEPLARIFLERIRLQIESGEEGKLAFDPDVGPEAVRVMTVHASKGLEFDYVFVVSMIDRRFPSSERSEQIELPPALVKEIVAEGDQHLEEERRLFYVAMTRAKKGLYLTWAEDYGGSRKRKPSRFLEELGSGAQQAAPSLSAGEAPALPPDSGEKTMGAAREHAPKSFSFTQLKAYENCPLQYKFAHVLKIPVKGKGQFSFGKAMHAAMQKLYALVAERQGSEQGSLFSEAKSDKAVGELVKENELAKIYEESWIDEWFESAETKRKYYEEGLSQLMAHYASVKDSVIRPLCLEKPFSLKIGGATLRGAIDRVDQLPDGTVRIVDYKTGTPKKEEGIKFEDKQQLLIYQVASLEALGKKPSSLVFAYLKDGSQIEFIGSEKDLDKIREYVEKSVEQIRSGDFSPSPSEHTCKYCDFRDICEFRIN